MTLSEGKHETGATRDAETNEATRFSSDAEIDGMKAHMTAEDNMVKMD
jgi:hypothetical protein